MRDLEHALAQIREIRAGVERGRLYRGFRAVPTAITGLFAAVTAMLQPWLVAGPRDYLALWIACAVCAAAAVAASMLAFPSPRTREALGRLAGPFAAGVLLTVALRERAPELLPGLWQVCFALAILAALPLLPRALLLVALFYLVSGVVVLGSTAPSAMGVPFAVGQAAAAGILHGRRQDAA